MENNKGLKIKELTVDYKVKEGNLRSVCDASFDVEEAEVTGLIGESGCGKTTIVQAILNILPPNGYIESGRVIYKGKNILELSPEEQRKCRWKEIATVFQAAQNSLNPVMKIKDQFYDVFEDHNIELSRKQIMEKIEEKIRLVKLDPDRVLHLFPHQLSGGMKQRVVIAMSLLLEPEILILDEPTTALDLITQSYIMALLKNINEKLNITMLMVSHDISNVAKLADKVVVMYAAQIIEIGTVEDIFYNSFHPYTKGLIDSTPSIVEDSRNKKPIAGDPPSLINPPSACRFSPRCEYAKDICFKVFPVLKEVENNFHAVSCHRWQELREFMN